jgi:hypothetical protein
MIALLLSFGFIDPTCRIATRYCAKDVLVIKDGSSVGEELAAIFLPKGPTA